LVGIEKAISIVISISYPSIIFNGSWRWQVLGFRVWHFTRLAYFGLVVPLDVYRRHYLKDLKVWGERCLLFWCCCHLFLWVSYLIMCPNNDKGSHEHNNEKILSTKTFTNLQNLFTFFYYFASCISLSMLSKMWRCLTQHMCHATSPLAKLVVVY
jgi:Ca2+/Na+ antiporter